VGQAQEVERVAVGRLPLEKPLAEGARVLVAALVETLERLADIVPRRSAAPPLLERASHG
jgi:hypothetical protein